MLEQPKAQPACRTQAEQGAAQLPGPGSSDPGLSPLSLVVLPRSRAMAGLADAADQPP